MGEDRPGAGPEKRFRPLNTDTAKGASSKTKPAAERLYGRTRGSKLRPRQEILLDVTLPRLLLTPDQFANPSAAFASPPDGLWVEVGFGGGEHARAQAAHNPNVGLIACEVYANGICSLLSGLVPEGGEATAPLPGNLRIWDDDARLLLRDLPAQSLDRLFLLFPDPWPKARHAKRRFVHLDNLPLAARVLKPGAEWRIASDDPTYQAWTAEVLAGQILFDVAAPATQRPQDWPPTRYERKAELAGRPSLYWSAIRTTAPA
jgi:tRNA (guanine-N7-)-methyltransferase